MTIVATGIDLAKNVPVVQCGHATGGVELRKPRVPRANLNDGIASLSPGLIGVEACRGTHNRAPLFHRVRHQRTQLTSMPGVDVQVATTAGAP